jgi:hypothetical protein
VHDDDAPELGDLLPLKQIARRIPGKVPGRKLHVGTLHRWTTVGVAVRPGGRRVLLRSWLVGGQRCTTERAVFAFMEQLEAGRRGDDSGDVTPVTPASERRRLDRVMQQEAAVGA